MRSGVCCLVNTTKTVWGKEYYMQTKVVNKYKDKYDVYIGRGSKWGNPYPITATQDRETVIAKYREYILSKPELLRDLHELKGKTLGCFCKPKPCHGDVLVELLNQREKPKMKQFNPMQYLAIDIANQWGLSKLNFEDRIDWVKTNEKYLEDFQDQAEEPILYYKAVKAFRDVQVGKPTGHTVALDSASSGLSLMSAVMRCKSGASLTGLIDPDTRTDAYTLITERVNAKLDSELVIPRKDSKSALMTMLYGSTKVPEEVFGMNVDLFYETVEEECNGAYTLLQLLLDSWDKKALHHSWYLPDGHYAHCPIWETKEKRINLSEWEYTPVATVKENTTLKFGLSNAANVVHS